MKWHDWRKSENVEDFTDPKKPVENRPEPFLTINERLRLVNSLLAKFVGLDDIGKK